MLIDCFAFAICVQHIEMGLCLCHKWLTQTLPSALFRSASNQWLELKTRYVLAFVISKILTVVEGF